MSTKKFVLGALLICALIAGGLSFYASNHPDGLQKVAADQSLDVNVVDSPTADSPLANYGVAGIKNSRLSGAAAGLTGVLIAGLAGSGLYYWVRKSDTEKKSEDI